MTLPTPMDISDLLCSLQERFDWQSDAEGFSLTDSWQRRSGATFFRMLGSPGGVDVVVKMGSDWDPGNPARIYGSMIELDRTIAAAGIDAGYAIRPIGWSSDPASVVMPYVEGLDLVSVLRDPGNSAWRDGGLLLRKWMVNAGEMLAAYHRAGSPCSSKEIEASRASVIDHARLVRLPASQITRIMAHADQCDPYVSCFGDFGPGNLLGTRRGDLYLLDPPHRRVPDLIHRDMGNFLFQMRRQLAGHGYTTSRPVRHRFPALRSAFLEGYANASTHGPLFWEDHALIALFELRRAVGLARKRWPARPRDSAWFAGSVLARRWELARLRA